MARYRLLVKPQYKHRDYPATNALKTLMREIEWHETLDRVAVRTAAGNVLLERPLRLAKVDEEVTELVYHVDGEAYTRLHEDPSWSAIDGPW